MTKHICTIIFSLFQIVAHAQSLHFSQIYSEGVMINPANSGNYTGNWRLNTIYRSQGNNFTIPYKTTLVGFDKHFYIRKNLVSGGICYINDFSAQNSLMINKLYVNGGVHVTILEKSILRFGLQAGVVQKSNSNRNLALPEQYDMSTGQFNSELPSGEDFAQDNIYYLDFAGGIMWQYKRKAFESEIGAAAYQLNKPGETFMNVEIENPVKFIFHGSLKKKAGENVYLKPMIYVASLQKASELLVGALMGYELDQKKIPSAVYAGLYVRGGVKRNIDAAIIAIGFNYNNWDLCFSYDYDISGLHLTTSRSNAFELSIIYIRPDTFMKKKSIPCNAF